jgi:hypothetical protein
VRALERAIGRVVRFKVIEWTAQVDAWELSPSSAPSPVPSLPSSPAMADTDATKGARVGDPGYDPVVEAEELEILLWLSRHDCEDFDHEAKYSVVWGRGNAGCDDLRGAGM